MDAQTKPRGPRMLGKRALITGAGSGIGRAAAIRLAAEGARVMATDLNPATAQEVVAVIQSQGGQAASRKLDVTSEVDWESATSWVVSTWGRLDVLVASAGISFAKPVEETSLEEWRAVMKVNLDGVFLGVKQAVLAMRRGSGGSIVILSSAAGIKAIPGASAYGASKAALRLFSKSVALECVQKGDRIRINTLHPAGVQTPMWTTMPFFQEQVKKLGSEDEAWKALAASAPLKRLATPEEIAEAILYLASDDSSYVTGSELVIDGGFTA